MINVLVTGANGQLGKELEYLLVNEKELFFIGTDIDTLDITEKEKVEVFVKENKINFIVNCAAYTAVDLAEDEPQLAFRINAEAPGKLAAVAKENNIGFITVSTDYVFNGEFFKPIDENEKPNPVSVYGKSKLEGEKIAITINPDTIIVRTAWLYSSFGKNFVKTILKLADSRKELSVIDEQVGSPTYARDLAYSIISILKSIRSGAGDVSGIYHYSNEGVCSWYDFAKEIIKLSGKNCIVNPVSSDNYPTKATRPYYSVLNKTKIKTTFKLKIPYWKDSLNQCLNRLLVK
ncbi:MAG: dTDP-4-dehydrorhamnose reductase [Bacteroidota bacterium]